jgi:hypothetical protein
MEWIPELLGINSNDSGIERNWVGWNSGIGGIDSGERNRFRNVQHRGIEWLLPSPSLFRPLTFVCSLYTTTRSLSKKNRKWLILFLRGESNNIPLSFSPISYAKYRIFRRKKRYFSTLSRLYWHLINSRSTFEWGKKHKGFISRAILNYLEFLLGKIHERILLKVRVRVSQANQDMFRPCLRDSSSRSNNPARKRSVPE